MHPPPLLLIIPEANTHLAPKVVGIWILASCQHTVTLRTMTTPPYANAHFKTLLIYKTSLKALHKTRCSCPSKTPTLTPDITKLPVKTPNLTPENTHLIKLVNETHAFVGQNQSTGLQRPLLGDGVSLDVGRQTHSRRSLTRREHHPRRHLLHVLEELRLCCPWVATHQDVEVAPHFVLAAGILGLPTKQRQRYRSLDVFVSVDGWGHAGKYLKRDPKEHSMSSIVLSTEGCGWLEGQLICRWTQNNTACQVLFAALRDEGIKNLGEAADRTASLPFVK